MKIVSFGTTKLFGIFDHEITLKQREHLTIIHGPNGFGKTTILRLLRDFFESKFSEFGTTPFQTFYITLDGDRTVTVTKVLGPTESQKVDRCLVQLRESNGDEFQHFVDTEDYEAYVSKELTQRVSYMQRVGPDLWEDTRDGELLDSDDVANRFGLNKKSQKDVASTPEWLSEIIQSVKVRLIETQRLTQQRTQVRRVQVRHQTRNSATVIDYAHQLANKIQVRFNEYARLSQQLDATFVLRLLKRDFAVQGETYPASSVAAKVENLNQKRRRLRESGLLSREDEPLPIPETPNYVIDEILNAYLLDVEYKLAVFDDLLERIQLLKSIVDAHLEFKKMVISQQFGFQFRATYDKKSRILPASLSSGEQHILILFYDLLFNESENSLILIDEPEISLHLDWQLSFLQDLRRIVSLVPHDILLATHSPQIINNDWDLTVALSRPNETLD
jgi:predicted ATP-binding protein involved in virulence